MRRTWLKLLTEYSDDLPTAISTCRGTLFGILMLYLPVRKADRAGYEVAPSTAAQDKNSA